jgi:hypothetical protein
MDGLAAYLLRLGDYVTGGDEKTITLVTPDWQRIERAYGHRLSADVRSACVRATTTFVLFEKSERTGSPVADLRTTIRTCKKRASEFQKALPSLETCEGSYAQLFVSESMKDPTLKKRPFEIMHGILASFDAACNVALAELSEYPSFTKQGDAWNSWLRKLNKILETHGLPSGVRKDAGNKSKTDKQSPFTLLVWELQSCLPVECRRPAHSKGALATAMIRALGSNKLAASSE